jgi:hypothetical protein
MYPPPTTMARTPTVINNVIASIYFFGFKIINPIIANINVTIKPMNDTLVLEMFSISIIEDKTTPANINLEMSRKYFPTSLSNSF